MWIPSLPSTPEMLGNGQTAASHVDTRCLSFHVIFKGGE